jgi:hypothetical protein
MVGVGSGSHFFRDEVGAACYSRVFKLPEGHNVAGCGIWMTNLGRKCSCNISRDVRLRWEWRRGE